MLDWAARNGVELRFIQDEDDNTVDYFAAVDSTDDLRWAVSAAPGDVAAIDRLFEEWAA